MATGRGSTASLDGTGRDSTAGDGFWIGDCGKGEGGRDGDTELREEKAGRREDHSVRKKKLETEKFTWRIEKFSELKEVVHSSDYFSAGGRRWRIRVYPRGNGVDALSVYLKLADSATNLMHTRYSLTVISQLDATNSVHIEYPGRDFERGDSWGTHRFVEMADLRDPRKGFLIDDKLIIEAEFITEVAAASEAASDGETKVIEADDDETANSDDVTSDDEKNLVETDDKPVDQAAIKKDSLTELHLQASHGEMVDSHGDPNGVEESVVSPLTTQLSSRNLIAELSTLTNTAANSPPNQDHSFASLQKQRDKLVGFLGMSLEAIAHAGSLNDTEETAVQLTDLAADPLEKTVLESMVSNLSKFKELIPNSLSAIETSRMVELSAAQATKDLEPRLVHRKDQLSSLEAGVSRLGEEGTKLEVEIQQLVARKAKILDCKSSTTADLVKATEEGFRELDELKKQRGERKQAVESRMRAKERLAQSNASWKLCKEHLGW